MLALLLVLELLVWLVLRKRVRTLLAWVCSFAVWMLERVVVLV